MAESIPASSLRRAVPGEANCPTLKFALGDAGGGTRALA
jgi:hypothetical protein